MSAGQDEEGKWCTVLHTHLVGREMQRFSQKRWDEKSGMLKPLITYDNELPFARSLAYRTVPHAHSSTCTTEGKYGERGGILLYDVE